MSEQGQQQQPHEIPIYNAQEPSEEVKRIKAVFDDLESKQLDTLDEAGKGLIERIATFLGVLFAVTVLSSNFPPPYLKSNTPAKIMIIITLILFLLAIGAGILATQVHYYPRYLYNVSEMDRELKSIVKHKVFWLRVANLLFALGAAALAGLLIVIIWNL
jgi:hypothetical protein